MADIIARLRALPAMPPRNALHTALVANFAARRRSISPHPYTGATAASLDATLTAAPMALPRTTLVGSQNLSLIAAVVQGGGGVGNTIVQAELPLLQAVPTWGNLYDCVVHRNGEVASAFGALMSMDAMIIAVADIPLPMQAVVGVTAHPDTNFRTLGLHQAARSERLHPVPSSEHTRDLLVRHHQPLNTPVFVVFVYGEASGATRFRLHRLD